MGSCDQLLSLIYTRRNFRAKRIFRHEFFDLSDMASNFDCVSVCVSGKVGGDGAEFQERFKRRKGWGKKED